MSSLPAICKIMQEQKQRMICQTKAKNDKSSAAEHAHLAEAEGSLDPGTEQLHNCTRQLQLQSQQLWMQLVVLVFSYT